MSSNMMSPGRGAGNGQGVSRALPGTPSAPPPSPAQAAWGRVKERLLTELGKPVYEAWFPRVDVETIEDGTVCLSVPTRFHKSWILQHYRERLQVLWDEEVEQLRRIEILVRGTCNGAREQAAPAQRAAPAVTKSNGHGEEPRRAVELAPLDDSLGSPLDRRLTLDSYMVGRSNELAHKAALQVANAVEPVPFNPLYVHASVGHGKTHLLHAIAQAARAAGRRVVYLTAEKFMYGFVAALKAQSAITFKEQLRGIDLLLIDDLQFLQGKHVQAEFGHTLNALLDGSRQVVVASDRPPCDLENLDERLQSRLAGGLSVEIGPPDHELRLKILKAKIAASRERYPNLVVPEAVIAYVAHAVQSNGRDLDGAFNRLVAHNQYTNAPLTVEMAETCLKDLVRSRPPKRVTIEDILRITSKHYAVSRQDLLSARRTRNVVLPRQVAMYLAKVLTPRSLPEIGRRFGGRDHTTVLHAVRKIEEKIKTDERLAQDVELVKRLLLDV